jgi:flagellar biosynthesis protein FlhA
MPLGRAFETYSILTVGDGLVSQIPAVIIAIASALLLARGGATGRPIRRSCRSWGGTLRRWPRWPCCWRSSRLSRPALPALPLGAAALGTAAFRAPRGGAKADGRSGREASGTAGTAAASKQVGDLLDIDDIHVEFAPDLVALRLTPGTGLDARIRNMREHIARSFGILLPEMRLTDRADLTPGTYAIRLLGSNMAARRSGPGSFLC